MLDKRSNAYVQAMNGLLQQAKRAARGFRTASNFIAIAYLRMSKLKHLPINPLQPAMPQAVAAGTPVSLMLSSSTQKDMEPSNSCFMRYQIRNSEVVHGLCELSPGL